MRNNSEIMKALMPIVNWANENNRVKESQESTFNLESIEQINANPFVVPDEFNGKDYITMLLHTTAEIEHGLMLQYLYAAYSIGGPQVPEKHRNKVRAWQETILGIAKEEMGHFISVQNVLKLIGAPLNFGRESYPWDIPFYPFPFRLEKFSFDSLAKYVYAESPKEWPAKYQIFEKEIKKIVGTEVKDPHTVGALFAVILQLLNDPAVIGDEIFQSGTFPYQAKFDEWGRGYNGSTESDSSMARPDLLVVPLTSRDDAASALTQISEQGEGDNIPAGQAPSHFERFVRIYEEMKKIIPEGKGKWSPSRNVAVNPYVSLPDDENSLSKQSDTPEENEAIRNPEGIMWGNLFNVRYHILLNYLNHSFLLDNGFNNAGDHAPRGLIINSTFGEMYNLRSIAMILVQTPLSKKDKNKMAGPPFMVPYTFDLPFGEHNRWRMHRDLLEASEKIIGFLKHLTSQNNHKYLNALLEADLKLKNTIEELTKID